MKQDTDARAAPQARQERVQALERAARHAGPAELQRLAVEALGELRDALMASTGMGTHR